MKTIPLKNSNKVALVDDDDFEKISSYKWLEHTHGYVQAWIDKKMQYMHRFIMGAHLGEEIDHIDKNKLNNQKSNLRFCSRSQNNANVGIRDYNTSGYKGVNFDKTRGKFLARIGINGKGKNLGRFKTPEEAALAYNEAAKKYFGEFAFLNEIKE